MKSPYTNSLYVEAINVLLRLRDDGSVFPGTLSMNAPEARARMPQGAAGMILQGPWNIPIWLRESPDFNFNIAGQPLLDPPTLIPVTVGPGGDNDLNYLCRGFRCQQADRWRRLPLSRHRSWSSCLGDLGWRCRPGHLPICHCTSRYEPAGARGFADV